MTDRSLHATEGGAKETGERHNPGKSAEIPLRNLAAEERARPLSPREQAKQVIEDCEKKLQEYDHYYRGSGIPAMWGLRQECSQLLRAVKYHGTLMSQGENYAKAFTENYRESARKLQDILDRYPKSFEGFVKQQVEACERQKRPLPRHMIERTRQELRERRSLLEQELGIPAIPAQLEQKGVLSAERRAVLARDYELIQQRGYTGDGFAQLEELVSTLHAERSVYEVTGKTTDSFTPAEKAPERQQHIARHMQAVAKEAGGKVLTEKVTRTLADQQIDQNVRTEIAEAFGLSLACPR